MRAGHRLAPSRIMSRAHRTTPRLSARRSTRQQLINIVADGDDDTARVDRAPSGFDRNTGDACNRGAEAELDAEVAQMPDDRRPRPRANSSAGRTRSKAPPMTVPSRSRARSRSACASSIRTCCLQHRPSPAAPFEDRECTERCVQRLGCRIAHPNPASAASSSQMPRVVSANSRARPSGYRCRCSRSFGS